MKVCVITGTRAEYGLLYWVLKALDADKNIELQLLVTGMHLSEEFGLTYKNIENDGFRITKKIDCHLDSDSAVGISNSMGVALIGFAKAFEELKPELIIVLGDRFEIFSAVSAAMIARIPVAHCHGGEATEGLIDESIRHSITKMSHLHFAATEEFRRRIIQLGEDPKNVFNVGALGIESINRLKLMSREELEASMAFHFAKKNVLVTFHPVTLENNTAEGQFKELLKSLSELKDTNIIFTKANADTDGRIINALIDEYVVGHKNAIAFASLGQLRYLSALKYVDAVVGNSSSGLIEAPSFKIPTVNIGDRQKGRIKAESVIDCKPNYESITSAIQLAFSQEFKNRIKDLVNPYGTINASEKIVELIKTTNLKGILKKSFYNISF